MQDFVHQPYVASPLGQDLCILQRHVFPTVPSIQGLLDKLPCGSREENENHKPILSLDVV